MTEPDTFRVLPERQWLKVEGAYVDVYVGEFDLPHEPGKKPRVRRCGHQHRTATAAYRCVAALENRVWRDAR